MPSCCFLTSVCSLWVCLCVFYQVSCPWLPSSWRVCGCLSTQGKGMKIWYPSQSVTHAGNPVCYPVPRAQPGSSSLEPFNNCPRQIGGNCTVCKELSYKFANTIPDFLFAVFHTSGRSFVLATQGDLQLQLFTNK